jgi:hypothetical protein
MGALHRGEIKRLDALVALLLARTASSSGPPPAGETVVRVPFTFSSTSPVLLLAIAAGGAVNRCAVVITTAFDDPAAALSVGTPFSPALVLAAGDIDPSTTGQYETDAVTVFASADELELTLSPGASTQGAGFVLVKEQ